MIYRFTSQNFKKNHSKRHTDIEKIFAVLFFTFNAIRKGGRTFQPQDQEIV